MIRILETVLKKNNSNREIELPPDDRGSMIGIKPNLKANTLPQLQRLLSDIGLEQYRAQQIFQWLWQKGAEDFSAMTNLAGSLRKFLTEHYDIAPLTIENRIRALDRTEKFLFCLHDQKRVEAVFIPEQRRRTICVSTQVGCSLGCKFCATALLGYQRDLFAFEIAEQAQRVEKETGEKASNLVLMGMGEPLLNISQVEQAIGIISSPIGLSISQKHLTLSTIGVIDGLRYLLDSPLKIKLAISLNFPDEDMRQQMMPATRKNPLSEILKLAREYSEKKHMVTFEYVVIDDLNDRIQDARILLKLLKNIPSKINIIPYNAYPSLPFKSPGPDKISRLQQFLMTSRHAVTVRKSHGQEILAGCGQLAGKYL